MTANNSHAQVLAADAHEPKLHAASHGSGGSDEIDVTGLSGAGGGVDSGTSFPISPTDGDLFYRTDLDLLCRYRSTGTRWVSATLYREPFTTGVALPYSSAGTTNGGRMAPWHTDFSLWLEKLYLATYVTTTNNGTSFWTVSLVKYNSALGGASTVASRATSADAADTVVTAAVSIGAVFDPASHKHLQIEVTKSSTAGVLAIASASLAYRLIAT